MNWELTQCDLQQYSVLHTDWDPILHYDISVYKSGYHKKVRSEALFNI